MKESIFVIFVITTCWANPLLASEHLLDTIIATVDDKPITLIEFGKRLHPPRKLTIEEIKADPSLGKALDGFILEKVLLAEAERKSIKVQDDDIEKYIKEVKGKNGLDDNGFIEALEKEGTSLSQYKDQIKTEILKSRVASASVKSSTALTEEEIDDFIRSRTATSSKEQTGKRIHVKYINLPKSDFTKDEANVILEKEKNGNNEVESLVDLGFVYEKDLSPEIFSVIAQVKDGEFSNLIENENGFQIYQIIESDNGPAKNEDSSSDEDPIKNVPEAVRTQLRSQLEQIKLQKRMEQFIDQELPKLHTIDKRI